MSDQVLTFYLTSRREGDHYELAKAIRPSDSIQMRVDLSDHTVVGANTYPAEILTRDLKLGKGLAFLSQPIDAPFAVSGMFSAKLRFRMNKRLRCRNGSV